MARKPRVHFEGALYHIMCRGNQGRSIFKDNPDRQRYIELLRESQKRFGYRLYAYVLMGNHVHLLLEIGSTPLSKVMQNILFRYTRYWNRRYRKIGHLFQGRYKAILCEKESYLLELIRYLHLNPVRGKMVREAGRYLWSSHRNYLEGNGRGWLAVEEVLARFGRSPRQAVAAYRGFVQDGVAEGHREDLYEVVDQRYLGDEAFVERVERRASDQQPARVVEIKWADVREVVCKKFGVSPSAVLHRGRRREQVRIKRVMAWVGREVGGFSHQEIARELRQDPTVLSRGLGKLADQLAQNCDLQTEVEQLCGLLRKGRRPKRLITHA
jgi:REP element-mobilizing transposase RayT